MVKKEYTSIAVRTFNLQGMMVFLNGVNVLCAGCGYTQNIKKIKDKKGLIKGYERHMDYGEEHASDCMYKK